MESNERQELWQSIYLLEADLADLKSKFEALEIKLFNKVNLDKKLKFKFKAKDK